MILLTLIFLCIPISLRAEESTPIKAEITSLNLDRIQVTFLEGDFQGQSADVLQFDDRQISSQGLREGSTVLISIIPGKDDKHHVIIVDQYRVPGLVLLLVLFFAVVVLIGKRKGVLSFLAMILTFFLIAQMVVPQILLGNNPLLISFIAAIIIIPVTFYVSHGISSKTTIAVCGTGISLIITGFLALIFVYLTKLTGFAAEEATFLSTQHSSINMQSLLLAGIVIGAMGVLDDITISQTAIVEKLQKANPSYTKWHLFRESMDVGRDHIASLVNTLVLVYAGAALPLFVLFSSSQFGTFFDVLNMEVVATEIVRTLVASIGIVSAVPITTAIAVNSLHSQG